MLCIMTSAAFVLPLWEHKKAIIFYRYHAIETDAYLHSDNIIAPEKINNSHCCSESASGRAWLRQDARRLYTMMLKDCLPCDKSVDTKNTCGCAVTLACAAARRSVQGFLLSTARLKCMVCASAPSYLLPALCFDVLRTAKMVARLDVWPSLF